jgi:hypothetical protein
MPVRFASRPRRRHAAALALAAACLLAAGCGGSSGNGRLLSQSQAGELRASLTRIEEDVAAKNCTTAAQEVSALQDQIGTIRRLDSGLRSSLRSSVQRLETLVNDSCQTTTTTPTTTTPTTGASGPSGATGPENGKQKKPKEPKQPKEQKNGQGNGNGPNGQGPPGQQGQGGGAGVPGESNPNGSGN